MDDNTNEPKVQEEILVEIKKMGDNYIALKKNYEEIQKAYKAAQDELKTEIQDKTKIERLKEELITRKEWADDVKAQKEAAEKRLEDIEKQRKEDQERLDNLEVAFKRPGGSGNTSSKEVTNEEMVRHYINCRSANDEKTSRAQLETFKPDAEAYNNYRKTFNKYLIKGSEIMSPDEVKTLSVGVDPHGGYTVMPAIGDKIIATQYETSPMRQLGKVVTISTDHIEHLVDADEAGAGWVNETGTRSNTDTPDFDFLKIYVGEMYALPKATQQLLEDSAINIETWLADKVADRFNRLEATAFISGDGIGGKPKGILSYADGTTTKTIEQVEMGAAATLTADGFIRIKYSLKEDYHGRGTWLMNRTTVRDAMLLKNGIGDYIWKPGLTMDQGDTILGFPVRMASDMPVVAAGALSVALADWSMAYEIVDRLGISVLRDPYSSKPYVLFYTRKRVGGAAIITEAIKLGVISV